MGDCCWADDWLNECCWVEEVVVVLIWVCSRWRERKGGGWKNDRNWIKFFFFFCNIFYCVDILFYCVV